MRLLLVHGRSQGGKDQVKLAKEWREVLEVGVAASKEKLPGSLRIDFPFYGDRLDEFVSNFDVSTDEVATKKGVGGGDEFADFAKQIALEAKEAKQISDTAVRADMMAKHGPQAVQKGPENWEWVQSIISLLDRLSPGTTEKTFSRFLRDVFLYTRREPVRNAINKIVSDRMTDEPTVVVGHSLGSVVAYNVMRGANKKSIRAVVTLGSPLGIRGISSSLATPLRNVAGTKGWFNAFDTRDVVALNPLDATFFPVQPEVVNDGTLENTTDNHHGIISYLDKAVVGKSIVGGFA